MLRAVLPDDRGESTVEEGFHLCSSVVVNLLVPHHAQLLLQMLRHAVRLPLHLLHAVYGGLEAPLEEPDLLQHQRLEEDGPHLLRAEPVIRASNEGSRRFYNHGEGPYQAILLIESTY